MRLPFAILCLASMLLGACVVAPAFAQDAVKECVTVDMNREAAARIGIPPENITLHDDVGFINAYIKAVGATIPDGSAPAKLMIATYPNAPGVWVGLVEADGCIKYSMKVAIANHLQALRAANESV